MIDGARRSINLRAAAKFPLPELVVLNILLHLGESPRGSAELAVPELGVLGEPAGGATELALPELGVLVQSAGGSAELALPELVVLGGLLGEAPGGSAELALPELRVLGGLVGRDATDELPLGALGLDGGKDGGRRDGYLVDLHCGT